ncbi:hypothetical protein SprV_0301272200 [Sparganum proliferum]
MTASIHTPSPSTPTASSSATSTTETDADAPRLSCSHDPRSSATVASANQFLERIKHLKLETDESMVSFDVVSLFTSIPQKLAIDIVNQLLPAHYEEREKPLKSEHLLELRRHCLKIYFNFDGQLYEQVKGPPMGSPLSDIIAEVVIQRI